MANYFEWFSEEAADMAGSAKLACPVAAFLKKTSCYRA